MTDPVDARIDQLVTLGLDLLAEARRLRGHSPFDAEAFARKMALAEDLDASLQDQLEHRVAALEEAPISDVARTRLADSIRASVAGFEWAGDDFQSQRVEAVTVDWLNSRQAAAA